MKTTTTFPISILSFLLMAACGGPAETPGRGSVATSPSSNASADVSRSGRDASGASADVAPAPRDIGEIGDAQEIDPMSAEAFLVWTRDSDGRATTHRLDNAGRELETVDGIFVATGAGAWQWREDPLVIETRPCERFDEAGELLPSEPTAPGEATRASLLHVAGGAEQVIVEPTADTEGAAEIQHGVELVASVGPYLFIRESTYAYTCGAHGNTGVSATLWDAVQGTSIAPPDDMGSIEGPLAKAIEELSDEDDDIFPVNESTVTMTELVPTFAKDGALELGVQFTAPTCYACSNGGWGSYTKSAIEPAAAMPSLFVPFAHPPEAVRAFATSHPDLSLGGWSPTAQSPWAVMPGGTGK
jgi:hypothetical protein